MKWWPLLLVASGTCMHTGGRSEEGGMMGRGQDEERMRLNEAALPSRLVA